ncbi:MAG TPA: SDR family oxidoreductase [Thermomicrobiales bacterium]|jgi:NAD(P)-dependent dehydrogenase (short-subunit alcohol dehydrogenase family)|nr:SDR family oxidoreductase [Thermomicrobiales bacterium]
MAVNLKPVSEQVIVITGASSGIGRATALAAAKQGARVVLAARSEQDLSATVDQITASGGHATYVVTDVGNPDDVERLGNEAIARYGGFDTWVNNAGVSILGRIQDISDEDHRKLFDTNFWGVVYGSRVAAQHLRAEGGAIINVGSELSDTSVPLQGMYSASKHAVKGFTDAFRIELEADDVPISLTLIKPAGINTLYPQHAKNYTDHQPKLPPPVYAPEEVAVAILHAAAHPRRDLYVGGGGKMMSLFGTFFPRAYDAAARTMFIPIQKRKNPDPNPEGSLWQSSNDGAVHGDHPGPVFRPSLYTRASLHPKLARVALGTGSGVAAGYLLRRVRRRADG